MTGLDFDASQTLYPRELELYRQLLRDGTRLPPLVVVEETFSTVCKEALLQEMRRRGAFGTLGNEQSTTDMDSYLWDCARWNGLVWRPSFVMIGIPIENAWWAGDGPIFVFHRRE